MRVLSCQIGIMELLYDVFICDVLYERELKSLVGYEKNEMDDMDEIVGLKVMLFDSSMY